MQSENFHEENLQGENLQGENLKEEMQGEISRAENARGVYIHVPFCMSKCPYCDFYSIPKDPALIEDFAGALRNEIAYYGSIDEYTDKPVESIYFGGGTPCLLSEAQLEKIMHALRRSFDIMPDAEISMEANPAAVSAAKLREFRRLGLNRLSIGAQSFDAEVLRILGRLHSAGQIAETIDAARTAGIENISLDLMFGISGQSQHSWEKTISEAAKESPEHISLYSLEIMDNTRFARDVDRGIYRQTAEEADRKMYAKALEMLEDAGYRQYEISNICKMGYECRHNMRYWNMGEYIGLGPAAHSFMDGTRYSNAADVKAYISQISQGGRPEISGYHKNSRQDNMSEYIFTGLRRNIGISKADFRQKFGEDIWQIYAAEKAEFDEFARGGFAIEDEFSIRLTRKGMDVSNKIMMIFV